MTKSHYVTVLADSFRKHERGLAGYPLSMDESRLTANQQESKHSFFVELAIRRWWIWRRVDLKHRRMFQTLAIFIINAPRSFVSGIGGWSGHWSSGVRLEHGGAAFRQLVERARKNLTEPWSVACGQDFQMPSCRLGKPVRRFTVSTGNRLPAGPVLAEPLSVSKTATCRILLTKPLKSVAERQVADDQILIEKNSTPCCRHRIVEPVQFDQEDRMQIMQLFRDPLPRQGLTAERFRSCRFQIRESPHSQNAAHFVNRLFASYVENSLVITGGQRTLGSFRRGRAFETLPCKLVSDRLP